MVTICGWVNFLGLKGPEKLGKTRQAASYAIWANSVADLVVRDMLRLSAKRRGFHQSKMRPLSPMIFQWLIGQHKVLCNCHARLPCPQIDIGAMSRLCKIGQQLLRCRTA